MAKLPILGYWDIRGRAQPIRFLLHYKKVKFVDKRYPYTEPEEWQKDKHNLGLDFPNLPYYIDEEVKLTQSRTILRYLAEKYDLDAQDKDERLRISLLEQQFSDFCEKIAAICYDENLDALKAEFVKSSKEQLNLFEAFLGDRKFMAGDRVTYVDFIAYESFDLYKLFIPKIYDGYPKLKTYYDSVRNLPQLQRCFNSTFKRWPPFSPDATFGVKGEEPK